jgi:hypothetical protein
VAALVIGVVVVALVVGRSALEPADDEPGTTGAASGTTRPDPPGSTTTTPTTSTAPPAPPAPPGPLRGLTATAITDAMSSAGWTCVQGEQDHPGYTSTSCTEPGNAAQLEMLSTPAGEPVYVETTVYLTADAAHLQHVASLGWEGVDAQAASTWIRTSIDSGAQPPFRNTFGGMPFELLGMPGAHTAWYLTIGQEPLA